MPLLMLCLCSQSHRTVLSLPFAGHQGVYLNCRPERSILSQRSVWNGVSFLDIFRYGLNAQLCSEQVSLKRHAI